VTTLDSTPGTTTGRAGTRARVRHPAVPEARSDADGFVPGDDSAERVPLLARPLASYYLILSTSGLLLALGLVMVLSASSIVAYATSGSPWGYFAKQALWIAIGLPLMWAASRMPVARFRSLAYPALLVTVVGLLLVLVPGVGVSANGATRWVGVGPFTLQPSEIAKLALVLWGADLLVRKRRLLGEWLHLLVPLLPMATLLCLLIMLQPDLGTAMVTFSVVLSLLWVIGAPMRLFGSVLGAVAFAGTLLAVLEPYRLERLTSFADPFADAQNTGYQAVQGLFALSSGGWWGLGLGASREKWSYLPHAHTDFILAIIGEELGLLGTLLVVVLFGVLAYAGIRVAQRCGDPFGRLVAAGITTWITAQALINMGAVVGLLPITGIPLPLISFGGSSLVPTLFAIGILLALAKQEPAARQVVADRAARRSARRRVPAGRGASARGASARSAPTRNAPTRTARAGRRRRLRRPSR
jgi:cell division protein FtsW